MVGRDKGNRTYVYVKREGKRIVWKLATWTQNRCEECGRFLSKIEKVSCEKCRYTHKLRVMREKYQREKI